MLMAQAGLAGEADVVGLSGMKSVSGIYGFDVTVKHADTGWDHCADNWESMGPGGTVIDKRVLLHLHVGEQPFTSTAAPRRPFNFHGKRYGIILYDKCLTYGRNFCSTTMDVVEAVI